MVSIKKKKSKKKIILLVIIIVLVVLAAAAVILFAVMSGKTNYKKDNDILLQTESETEKQLRAEDIYDLSQVSMPDEELTKDSYTLLVIGGDTPEAEEDGNRKDAQAVILMSINHRQKMAYFASMRTDLYVHIPQEGGEETGGSLGHAYALGGGPLLSEVIEKNYGIPIDNYAAVSLKDVARIIGMPEFEKLNISEDGLDVVEEMIYSLNAVRPAEVAGWISQVLPYVTHNITPEEMLRIIMQIPAIVGYYSEKTMVPFGGTYRMAEGYTVPDIGATSRRLQKMFYGE